MDDPRGVRNLERTEKLLCVISKLIFADPLFELEHIPKRGSRAVLHHQIVAAVFLSGLIDLRDPGVHQRTSRLGFAIEALHHLPAVRPGRQRTYREKLDSNRATGPSVAGLIHNADIPSPNLSDDRTFAYPLHAHLVPNFRVVEPTWITVPGESGALVTRAPLTYVPLELLLS